MQRADQQKNFGGSLATVQIHISLWRNKSVLFYFPRITTDLLVCKNMTERKKGERWELAAETARPAQQLFSDKNKLVHLGAKDTQQEINKSKA